MGLGKKGFALGWVVSADGNKPLLGDGDVQVLRDAGAQIVRFDIQLGTHPDWDNVILQQYSTVVQQLKAAGIAVIGLLGHGIVAGAQQMDWNANAAEQGSNQLDNTFLANYASNASIIAGALQDITLWELWNEPNQWDKAPDPHGSPDQPGGSFIFPSLYARLLRRTVPGLKQLPNAPSIITGGLFGHDGAPGASSGHDYLQNVLTFLGQAPLAGDPLPFDAVGQHLYLDQGAAAQSAHLNQYLNLIAGLAGGRPIYITEAGWTTTPGFVTVNQQAANLTTLYDTCQASAQNIAAACWFELYDNPGAGRADQRGFGAIMAPSGGQAAASGQRKPAFSAFQKVEVGVVQLV